MDISLKETEDQIDQLIEEDVIKLSSLYHNSSLDVFDLLVLLSTSSVLLELVASGEITSSDGHCFKGKKNMQGFINYAGVKK